MGQFKPMPKMKTTEPTVELKLKKGGPVKKAMGGAMPAAAMPSEQACLVLHDVVWRLPCRVVILAWVVCLLCVKRAVKLSLPRLMHLR